MIAVRKIDVAGDPHDPGGEALIVEDGDPPRPDERCVVRVERHGRVEDDERQERVLGHLGEQVADPGRVAHPPGRRIERHGGPPEEERPAQEQQVLEVVDQRILERRVEQRREVDRPHHRGEHQPRRHGVGHDPDDPRMQHRQEPAMARLRGAQAEDQRDRCRQREQRGGDQHQQHVLDHVDREQRGVVAGDPRHQGERQRGHPAEERDRPPTRDGVRGVDGVDPPDRPQPPADGDRDAQRRQRLERPAEQERPGRRGLEGHRAVGRRRTGQDAATRQREADRDRPSDHPPPCHRRHGRTNGPSGRHVHPTGSSLRETHARRIEWSRFGPGSTRACSLIGRFAPQRRAAILEDVDVELPKVALLPDRDLRPRRRCRAHRRDPHPAVLRRERARRQARRSSPACTRRSRSRRRARRSGTCTRSSS